MFTPEDILNLRIYCQSITRAPRHMEEQLHTRAGVYLWCEDWLIIELCKYLFHGKETYYGDPPPNRLKNNPLFSKDAIAGEAEQLIAEYKTADAIIAHFTTVRAGGL